MNCANNSSTTRSTQGVDEQREILQSRGRNNDIDKEGMEKLELQEI